MALLSDFIHADCDAGAAIGKCERPADQWPCLEGWKGIEPVKVSTLHFCITGEQPSVDQVVDLSSLFELAGGDEESGPWVIKIPSTVVATLASVSPASVPAIAAKWAVTEELQMDGWSAEDAAQFIDQIQPLAAKAVGDSKCIYLWVSL